MRNPEFEQTHRRRAGVPSSRSPMEDRTSWNRCCPDNSQSSRLGSNPAAPGAVEKTRRVGMATFTDDQRAQSRHSVEALASCNAAGNPPGGDATSVTP